MAQDFISGRDLQRKVYFNNNPWPVNMKTLGIEQLATEITDQVGGELRPRFDVIPDGFRVTCEAFMDSQSLLLENFIAQIAASDAGGPQLAANLGIIFKYRDLTRGRIVFRECTIDPFNLNDGGRTERVMFGFKFRARWMDKLPG